jgi:hypothetical protein
VHAEDEAREAGQADDVERASIARLSAMIAATGPSILFSAFSLRG